MGTVVVLVLLGGVTLVLLLRSSTSSPAPAAAAASTYQTLSDGSIRRCPPPPEESGLAGFDACLRDYLTGLDALSLPSTLATTVHDVHGLIQQLSTCRSHQLHEDVTMREWPVGCPQPGPATVTAAASEDVAFRHQDYSMLLGDDNVIRRALALPVGAAASAA